MGTHISKKSRLVTGVVIALSLMNLEVMAVVVHYADSTLTTGADDGTSWCDAFHDLQDAIAAAGSGDVIKVANGTYKPAASGVQRVVSFALKNGVSMYGGYRGCDPPNNPDDRDISLFESKLSGDLDDNDVGFTIIGLNSFHVVVYGFPGTCVGGTDDKTGCGRHIR